MVAVLNLLSQMTILLELELESLTLNLPSAAAATAPNDSTASETVRGDPLQDATSLSAAVQLDSLPFRDSSSPYLDLLLSDNILSHVLATSRMPVRVRRFYYVLPRWLNSYWLRNFCS